MRAARLTIALLIGVAGFGYRVLTARDLSDDHFMHMAWAQQVLLGALPGREFVDPGMPLTYVLSAFVQNAWPGPFSEVLLTAGVIAAAAAITCFAAARLSGSYVIGVAAALLQLMLHPRLYSYPKILVPVMMIAGVAAYLRQPTRWRLWLLALWTVIAVLLRHDLGVYAGAAVVAGLVAAFTPDLRRAARVVGAYALATLVVASPYIAYVAATEGVGAHVRAGREFAKGEEHQLLLDWDDLPNADLTAMTDSAEAAGEVLFYQCYGLLIPAILLLLLKWKGNSEVRGTATAAIVMLAAYLPVILRHPLDARVPDMAGVLSLALAWVVGQSWQTPGAAEGGRVRAAAARVTGLLAVALLSFFVVGAAVVGNVTNRVRETGIAQGLSSMLEELASRKEEGTAWPWTTYWPAGDPPEAIGYLNRCTTRNDRFLVSWTAPHYFYFARRGFAAGHPWFIMRGFQDEQDQRLMIDRLTTEQVPIVLLNETNTEFVQSYPLVAAHIRATYSPVGHFTIRGGDDIAVLVRNGATALHADTNTGWPCGIRIPT